MQPSLHPKAIEKKGSEHQKSPYMLSKMTNHEQESECDSLTGGRSVSCSHKPHHLVPLKCFVQALGKQNFRVAEVVFVYETADEADHQRCGDVTIRETSLDGQTRDRAVSATA